jgi:hypothetical protein
VYIDGGRTASGSTSGTVYLGRSKSSSPTINYSAVVASSEFTFLKDIKLGGSSGTAGQVLTSAGTGAAPTWSTAASGTVTSVSSANSFLTVATGTTTPVLTVNTGSTSSTVAIGNDTRFNPAPSGAGKIAYDNGTAYVALAAGTANQVLHGGATPSWSAVSLSADVTGTLPIANGGTGNGSTVAINTVFAGPASGSAGAPSYRNLVAADFGSNTIPASQITSIPYDIAGAVAGTPTTSTECFFFVAVRSCTVQATGHYARCQKAPSGGNATFTVYKQDTTGTQTSIGTFTINSGNKSASFSLTATTLAANESLVVTSGSNMYGAYDVFFTFAAVVG